jgi:predicted CXXCH cytochrome family protein
MSSIQRECDGCHTPHKRPYDTGGAGISYSKLLRTQLSTAPATYHYNTAASAIGNQLCADCHGAGGTNIALVAGDLAYTNSGGDHLTDYNASAHGPGTVPANSGGANPNIQCEACHNNHASPVEKLIDYRSSNVSDTQNRQSGLCFKCHSVGGAETGKPNTWNGRDVKAQFELAKSQVAQKANKSPKGVDYNWFPGQEQSRSKRVAGAKGKADSERQKAIDGRFAGRFDQVNAAEVFGQYLLGASTEHLLEMSEVDRHRVFNLGYYTWVEQQHVPLADFEARRHQRFWTGLHALVPQWDAMIAEFNQRTGVTAAKSGRS